MTDECCKIYVGRRNALPANSSISEAGPSAPVEAAATRKRGSTRPGTLYFCERTSQDEVRKETLKLRFEKPEDGKTVRRLSLQKSESLIERKYEPVTPPASSTAVAKVDSPSMSQLKRRVGSADMCHGCGQNISKVEAAATIEQTLMGATVLLEESADFEEPKQPSASHTSPGAELEKPEEAPSCRCFYVPRMQPILALLKRKRKATGKTDGGQQSTALVSRKSTATSATMLLPLQRSASPISESPPSFGVLSTSPEPLYCGQCSHPGMGLTSLDLALNVDDAQAVRLHFLSLRFLLSTEWVSASQVSISSTNDAQEAYEYAGLTMTSVSLQLLFMSLREKKTDNPSGVDQHSK